MVMIKPIASGAIAFGPRGSTTVPKMTKTRKNVITPSMISAPLTETSGPSPGSPEIDPGIIPPHRSQGREDQRSGHRLPPSHRALEQ